MGAVGLAAENKPRKKITKTVVTTIEEVDDTAPATAPEEKGPKIVKEDSIYENSSEHNRMNKKYAAWAQLLGVGPSISSSRGLAFGKYHTSYDIFFLEVTDGSDGWSSFGGFEYDINTKSIGVHWKHFTGNSFYFNTGIDFRKVDYDYRSTVTSTQSHFDSTSAIISFAIGNQWQWNSFTMGCDWIGLSLPVADKISNASITTGSAFEEGDFKDDQDLFSGKTHIQLLRFYLGASF